MHNQPDKQAAANAFADCLRPAFTELLVKKLVAGQTINLIGQHGQGRRRTITDLRKWLPDTLLVLHVDMKSYRQSYAGFIESLWLQTGNSGEAPDDLARLLKGLQEQTGRILFILHNFDALRSYPDLDPKYNPRFFDHLNSIKNHPDMALLVVSEQEYEPSQSNQDKSSPQNVELEAFVFKLPDLNLCGAV